MAQYIDRTYVDNAFGSDFVDKLIDGTSAILTQLIKEASAVVDGYLDALGYSVPLSNDPPIIVKRATLGALAVPLFARKNQKLTDAAKIEYKVFNDLTSGKLSIPGLKPKSSHTVGGSKWSSKDDRPAVFKDMRDLF